MQKSTLIYNQNFIRPGQIILHLLVMDYEYVYWTNISQNRVQCWFL
jgi:hypothetical protein